MIIKIFKGYLLDSFLCFEWLRELHITVAFALMQLVYRYLGTYDDTEFGKGIIEVTVQPCVLDEALDKDITVLILA